MAILDIAVTLMTLSLSALTLFAAGYWVYAQRRIRYLEARLWLRSVGMENPRHNKLGA